MPVINPATIKFFMLLLGSLLVLSPITLTDNQEIIVLHEIESHYEVKIPAKDGTVTLYIPIEKPELPIDGIFILNKKGKVTQRFDAFLYEEEDIPYERIRDEFADFFQILPKDKKELIAPWLEKAIKDHDALLKELENKAKE